MLTPCVLLALLSAFLLPTHAQEGSICNIPNSSKQSTCLRLHYCDSFMNIIRSAGGRPSKADGDYIKLHGCGTNLVCCPDNVFEPTTTTTVRTTLPQPAVTTPTTNPMGLPPLTDLTKLKTHRNFRMINGKQCGLSGVFRIIGGEEAGLGQFPWMALLRFKGRLDGTLSFNCGGSLVHPKYVLTAAHCVFRDLVSVRLGEHDISSARDCEPDNSYCLDPVQDIDIEDRIKHPKYDNQKKINDIALLRLVSSADISKKNVKPICLPTETGNQIEALDPKARELLTITGWGLIESGEQSNVLRRAFVPFVNNADCKRKFSGLGLNVYETYLCAGGVKKTDTCKGDSGGPIQTFGVVNDNPQRIIQYGVVSGGIACLEPELIYPGIYTFLPHYLDWILDNMRE